MRFSKLKKINLENIKKEKYQPGVYKLFNKNKKCIYVGSSQRLKHRLEAHLYGRSDYRQVNGKMKLHKEHIYYATCYCDIYCARGYEKKNKKNYKYNIL